MIKRLGTGEDVLNGDAVGGPESPNHLMTQSPSLRTGEDFLKDGAERPHKGLLAWQTAIDLTETVYRVTESFPAEERFGLTSQMRRAAVSVASNIAEGAARSTDKEKVQFYMIARGSLSELDTQVEIVARLGFVNEESRTRIQSAISKASALLQGLIRSKQAGPNSSRAQSPNHLIT